MNKDTSEDFAMGLFALSATFGLIWYAFAVVAQA